MHTIAQTLFGRHEEHFRRRVTNEQWKTAIDQYRPYLSINDAFKTLKYKSEKFELLTYSATTALINNKIPLAASNLKNHLKPEDI